MDVPEETMDESCLCTCGCVSRGEPQRPQSFRFAMARLPLRTVLLAVIAFLARIGEGATFGGWECKLGKEVISKGDFTDHNYAPFVSPQQEASGHCKGMYLEDMDCSFVFHGPAHHLAYVEFVAMELDKECSKDFVTIKMKHQHRHVCKKKKKSGAVFDISDDNKMEVQFKTNKKNSCQGFAAFFTAFPDGARKRSIQLEDQASNSSSLTEPQLHRIARAIASRETRAEKKKPKPKKKKKKSKVKNLKSLNEMMLDYRQRYQFRLTTNRQNLLTKLWKHDYCQICKTAQVRNCRCHQFTYGSKNHDKYSKVVAIYRGRRGASDSDSDDDLPGCGCR